MMNLPNHFPDTDSEEVAKLFIAWSIVFDLRDATGPAEDRAERHLTLFLETYRRLRDETASPAPPDT
jgi:hypothetical protein